MKTDITVAYDFFLNLLKGTEKIVVAMRDNNSGDDLSNLSSQIGLINEMIQNMEGLKGDLEVVLSRTKEFSA